ncbi:hypothetical protein [Xenorhabdus anantnagensis]|uniref:Transposase n=1 Tax=Xenorhabdus anantnagensis TaxID=3025875 RepID=A0ABT5LSP1_9GAMM|nr:hypothetical protein [Xenorhabdus anantnagensis]MDC9597355.1 hypothetical protein [Xenorhabdus anantnagensis]
MTTMWHLTLRRFAMPDGTSTFARFLLTVYRTQGVTFGWFIAESDAAAKGQHTPDKLWLS